MTTTPADSETPPPTPPHQEGGHLRAIIAVMERMAALEQTFRDTARDADRLAHEAECAARPRPPAYVRFTYNPGRSRRPRS